MIDFDFLSLGEYSIPEEKVFFFTIQEAEEYIKAKGEQDNERDSQV